MRTPIDNKLLESKDLPATVRQYLSEISHNLHDAESIAQKNVLEAQGVYKKYYDDHQNPRGLFQLGDYVLMKEVAIRKGKGHKLDRPMSGPYYITYKGQHESYKLREVGSNKLVPGMVHGRRLVKYNLQKAVSYCREPQHSAHCRC